MRHTRLDSAYSFTVSSPRSVPPRVPSLPSLGTHWAFCLEHIFLSLLLFLQGSVQRHLSGWIKSSLISRLASHSPLSSPSNTRVKSLL